MIIKCEKCGVDVICFGPTRRFCSDRCAYLTRYTHLGRKKGKFIPCSYCKKELWTTPWRLKNYKKRFCDKECLGKFQMKNTPLKCAICFREFYCSVSQQNSRNRVTCSSECRGKLYTQRAEEKRITNPPTKHALDRNIRYSKKTDDWRKSVFERDNYTCQECKVRGNYLEAHHIKPFAYFPELRFELSNGQTLCRKCHDKTKISAKEMRKLYEKNDCKDSSNESRLSTYTDNKTDVSKVFALWERNSGSPSPRS